MDGYTPALSDRQYRGDALSDGIVRRSSSATPWPIEPLPSLAMRW